MKSIVIELQQKALDKDVPVTDLLRKSYVVSKKLKLKEFEQWIQSELNGYSDDIDIPKYREMKGIIKTFNRYHGWQPLIFEEPKMEEMLSTRKSGQRIAEIENLLNTITDPTQGFQIPYSAEEENIICDLIRERVQVTLMTTTSDLVRIVDAVRNVVLNWSLQLEKDGILGENMTFTENEKDKSIEHSYNINNFYGGVTGSQIQQSSIDSVQTINNFSTKEITNFISSLKDNLKDIELDSEKKKELEAEIATIEIQTKSPKPKESIIKEGLTSIRNILEGASGSGIYQLLTELGKFFS